MAMSKDYYFIRLQSAMRRANDSFPGTLRWSDVRWEIEKARTAKAAEALAGIVKDVPLDELGIMYEVALEQEAAERAAPSQSSTAAVKVDIGAAKVQEAIEIPKPTKPAKPAKQKKRL